MAEFTAKVTGIAEYRVMIESLIGDMKRKVVRGALRDAARPIAQHAKGAAPVLKKAKKGRLPGTLKKSIRVFASKIKNGSNGVLGVYIGVKGNARRMREAAGRGGDNPHDPFYAHWQEAGFTATGRRKLRGGQRARRVARNALLTSGQGRRIPGIGFMRSAFAGQSAKALEIFQRRIVERIESANRRR